MYWKYKLFFQPSFINRFYNNDRNENYSFLTRVQYSNITFFRPVYNSSKISEIYHVPYHIFIR